METGHSDVGHPGPIVNPYTKRQQQIPTEPPRQQSINDRLMKAAREQQSKKKGKRKDPPARSSLSGSVGPLLNPSQPRSAISRTVQSTSRKKRRTVRNDNAESDNNEEGGRALGGWTEYTWNFLKGFQKWLTEQVYFDQRGHHDLKGMWPADQLYGLLKPTDDPVTFMQLFGFLKEQDSIRDSIEENDGSDAGRGDEPRAVQASKRAQKEYQYHEMLTREDFALPDVLFWSPETRWPQYYQAGRPNCPWHKCSDCVHHLGSGHYFRRAFAESRNVAIGYRRYKCQVLESAGEETFTFRSIDPAVIEQAHIYVRTYWRREGFCITHKAAVSWKIVDQMRSLLANGSGASGYHKALVEAYKQEHSRRARMWLGNSDFLRNRSTPGAVFFDFDDLNAEMQVPSLSWLLRVVLTEIESHIPYYTHRLTMQLGQFLSADHSHKVAKVVLVQGERGFDGIYTVMNEFGKILGFWFVSGTTLREVEDALRGLARRYKVHGVEGPKIFSVDRCCSDRQFLVGSENKAKTPILPSLLGSNNNSLEEQNETASYAQQGGSAMTLGQGEERLTGVPGQGMQTTVTVKRLALPSPPVIPSSMEVKEVTAEDIVRKCDERQWSWLGFDSEWVRGTKNGPDTIQLVTQDSCSYVFCAPFPNTLKQLLQNPQIGKVAHTISSDRYKLTEIGIVLRGEISLGHIARDRGVVEAANKSLAHVVFAVFGCELPKENDIRFSNWAAANLSTEQLNYAALDAYAHMITYKKLLSMTYVDPFATPRMRFDDLQVGRQLLLYTRNNATVVTTGTFVGPWQEGRIFRVTSSSILDVRLCRADVRRLSAVVGLIDHQPSFSDLLDAAESDDEAAGFVNVPWRLERVRLCPKPIEPHEEVNAYTMDVEVPITGPSEENNDDAMPPLFDQQDEDDDNSTKCNDGDDDDESSCAADDDFDFDEDSPWFKYYQGVKQDIIHIFLRFVRVLSKEHGAFGAFLSRLSDAFFIPSQVDIELVKSALRKAGLSEDEIRNKTWQYYKRRIRRRVPMPDILEREFRKVVNLFADVVDARTQKKLFNRKAWKLVKTTLKHIRRGCLSDKPGISYYICIGEDSLGIPLYKCVRGTSALEGFHQKIRQLIRGFNLSPRFAIALLFEFIHRWNHNIDVSVLGMPKKYDGFYDHWDIEEEIDLVATWVNYEGKVHTDFETTKDFQYTGEKFGLLHIPNDENDLEKELEQVADALLDGFLDCKDNDGDESGDDVPCEGTDAALAYGTVTASGAWLGQQLKRSRGIGKVKGKTEKEFFRNNYHRFQNDGSEADNYSSIAFGRFSGAWNEVIREEEAGLRPKTDMTCKTAYHLQAYWKEFKRLGNIAATLQSVHTQNKEMRRNYRYSASREETAVIPQASDVTEWLSEQQKVRIQSQQTVEHDSSDAAVVQMSVAAPSRGVGSEAQRDESAVARRGSRRCRKCGHEYGKGNKWAQNHTGIGKIGSGVRPEQVCDVPKEDYVDGFPLKPGQKFPRRSRNKK